MEYYKQWEMNLKPEELEDEVLQFLKDHGYFAVAQIDVRNILMKNFNRDINFFKIFEICKPKAALELLERDKLTGLFVPCKINIVSSQNGSILRLIRLDVVSENFIPDVNSLLSDYQTELVNMLDEFAKRRGE